MTNKEIKKYKQLFSDVKKGVNKIEKESLKERLKKLIKGIEEAQELANDVCAKKYLGTDVIENENSVNTMDEKIHTPLLREKIHICEEIFNGLCRNIYDALNTEEMFNACVSAEESSKLARKSCRWAAIAAIAACIGIFITWWPSISKVLGRYF